MPDLHKTLILANIRQTENEEPQVEELAIATEHAPFRHRKTTGGVGSQRKRPKVDDGKEKEGEADVTGSHVFPLVE